MRVAIAGIGGRTGGAVARVLDEVQDPDVTLQCGTGQRSAGRTVGDLLYGRPDGRPIHADLEQAYRHDGIEAVVDFSVAEAAASGALQAIRLGVIPVIGTTGLSDADVAAIEEASLRFGVPAALIANFSLGAFVLERCARMAAQQFPDLEIIEMHGAHKRDKPSGTALRMAAVLAGVRDGDIPIHSVRLPGLVAHQEVLLGGEGEVLTLRHDALSRACYAPGVLQVLRRIRGMSGLQRSLEPFVDGPSLR